MTDLEVKCYAAVAALALGVVALWLVVLLRYERTLKRSREAAAWPRAVDARQRAADAQYLHSAHALSCARCGELAYPLGGTTNRYRCEGCRRQFAGARHPC